MGRRAVRPEDAETCKGAERTEAWPDAAGNEEATVLHGKERTRVHGGDDSHGRGRGGSEEGGTAIAWSGRRSGPNASLLRRAVGRPGESGASIFRWSALEERNPSST